mmetsp:Transcript_70430/g.150854  ORF Transcript_70430/g.150854 Transcript_70430/m.150854 type:complete len:511 (-) Transcript_70430:75-1607(-)
MSRWCAPSIRPSGIRHVFLLSGLVIRLGSVASLAGAEAIAARSDPYVIPLRREVHPVRRKDDGEVVSLKTTYSGVIAVGYPEQQEFRVVFDTGSGHMILPSVKCTSSTCLKHRRYDPTSSGTARSIQLDGTPVAPGERGDAVTIGFGTGQITGEFAREWVCLSAASVPSHLVSQPSPDPIEDKEGGGGKGQVHPQGPCLQSHFVQATAMSEKPFDLFAFDGILGLGLRPLALTEDLSFLTLMSKSDVLGSSRFGLFLAEGEEESEIAFGEYNQARLLEPLAWVPLKKPELGYWQIEILAIRIDGRALDACSSSSPCNGILDSGTSHLGVPAAHESDLSDMLTKPAGDVTDCRRAHAPVVELQLRGVNLTLHAENYMRQMPLARDVFMGTDSSGLSLQPPRPRRNSTRLGASWNYLRRALLSGSFSVPFSEPEGVEDAGQDSFCTPKLMPVSLPVLGQNAFILGEPLLHRYYTVFDAEARRAGFGLAKHSKRSLPASAPEAARMERSEIVL